MAKHRDRARDMRNHPTEAECKLWGHLRAQQMRDWKFRRQACIGEYIVDFVTYGCKVIVELDGSQHAQQVQYDNARTKWLESQGFEVVRFWNHEIFEELDAVLEKIHYVCRRRSEEDERKEE